ncbi:MAG: sigma-70 family RNA polymerase sigma factor [Caldilineaceae bacterium]
MAENKQTDPNGIIDQQQPTDLPTLASLVQQAQAGDPAAFAVLVARFQDMAVGYGYSLLGDWGLAEDAAQEAFLNAYLALTQLREPAAFPGWFRRILFKQGDRLVRGKQASVMPLDAAEAVTDPGADLFDHVARDEMRQQVHAAIATLPLHEREVVTLFYIGQHSHKEIAAFLELSITAVKSRLFSARKRLKASILTMIQATLPEQRPSKDNTFQDNVMVLFRATTAGDITAVKRLLASDAGLAHATGLAHSPLWQAETSALQLAVMYGRKDIADLLLHHGADINAVDPKSKFTPLLQALDLAGFIPSYAELKMVEFLRERGAQQDIFAALWSKDIPAVQALLEHDASCANAIGPGNRTPLCYTHTVEVAELLLAHGADMHMALSTHCWPQRTPLGCVHGDVLRYLLQQAQIDVDSFWQCKLGEGEQVLAQLRANPALVHGQTDADHPLGAGVTLLHLAVTLGQTELVQQLLTLGANVNQPLWIADNMTPLHLAICYGKRELLTEIPAELTQIEQPGVLYLAPAIPKLLLAHGADHTARDRAKGWTPLQWAEANLEDETDRSAVIALLRAFPSTI